MVAVRKIKKKAQAQNKYFALLVIYVVYIWSIIHTYDYQIAAANAYAGMQPWEMTFIGWIFLILILIVLVFITSRLNGYPSDFFVIFYSSIPVISFCTLTSTSGKISELILLPSIVVIVFPLFALLMVERFFPKIRWHGIVSSRIIDKILLSILFIVIIYSYINSPSSASFDIINSYDRRLEGREIYTAGSFIAYALIMCMNGFTPYLAFRGSINNQSYLILISFGATVFFYWLLGVKAPLAFVVLGCLVGYLTRINYLKYFINYFLVGVIMLYLLVLLEWAIFDDYSITADYGFRRLFPVQAEVQGYYLDFLMINTPSFWNFMSGVGEQSIEVTYYIGSNYLGNPDTNANTNAFLYAIVANGILGYFLATFFVAIFLVLLDRLYRPTQNPGYILIGLVYGYLITEQAFSTAMVSSGVGLLFLLTLLEKYEHPILNVHELKYSKIRDL
jgi:hypothetical protein